MKPSVGRTVHYVSYGTPGGEYPSVCRAAIVTSVEDYEPAEDGSFLGYVDLCVLNPEGMFFNRKVHHFEDHGAVPKRGGTWHWPERVD